MVARDALDVSDLLDRAPVSSFHGRVLALCAFSLVVDGFDLLAMSAAAPSVAADFQVPSAAFGPVLSASLFGAAIGGVLAGPVGDRIGRRPLLIGMFLLAAIVTAATAFCTTLDALIALRLLTGLFVGGAVPPALALAAEYYPASRRQLLLIIMVGGAPLGSALASLSAPSLIARFGWEGIFVVGGGLALACGLMLAAALPESLRFLVLKGRGPESVAALIAKIAPQCSIAADQPITVRDESTGASAKLLFADGRAGATLLLWVVYIGSQAQLYFLGSWLPILFRESGLPLATALYGTMAHQAGGVFGSIAFGFWSDRVAPERVMAWMYALAIVSIPLLGLATGALPLLFILAIVSGIGAVGVQSCVHAFAATFYPTLIRTTGVGWGVSVGRLGAIVSPLIGGMMLGAGWPVPRILLAVSVAPLMCLAAVEMLRRLPSRA